MYIWKHDFSPIDTLRVHLAKYNSQDVPEVPLHQLCEYVHLLQAHLPANQPCQWHSGPKSAWGLGQCCCRLQLLFQAWTLTSQHLGMVLTHSLNQLQRWSQREVNWSHPEWCDIWIAKICRTRGHVFCLGFSHSLWGGIIFFCWAQAIRAHGITTFNRGDTARGDILSKNLILFRMAVTSIRMLMLSVCWVFLRLRATFFKRREPVLTLQTGAAPSLCWIWSFRVSFGGRQQQLLERAIMVHCGVLRFIKSHWAETAVLTQRPV